MAHTRASALSYVQGIVNPIYVIAEKPVTDTADGYKPAIDGAFRLFGDVSPILDADDAGFEAILRYYAYDFALPALAIKVDQQFDAPLSNLKASQITKAVRQLRDDALTQARQEGVDPLPNVVWHRWMLDHLEPDAAIGIGEFAS